VKRVDLDLQQAHLSLHLIDPGFSLFEALAAHNMLRFAPRILGQGDLRIHLINNLGEIGRRGIYFEVQTIQSLKQGPLPTLDHGEGRIQVSHILLGEL